MRSFIFASLFAVTLVSPTLALQNSRRSHQRVRQALDLDLGLHLRVDASSDSSSDAETATSTIAPSSSAVPSITATSTALPVSTSGLYGVGDGNKYATIHFMVRSIRYRCKWSSV